MIGVHCAVPPGVPIVARSRGRDADLDDEDYLTLVFDTFRDGRSGYFFAVGPAGARTDGLITNQGEGTNAEWDADWEAAAAVSDSGWSVEIRLPVRSFSFDPGSDAWAFNVERRIQAALEVHRWTGVSRNRQIGQTTGIGLLVGLPRFDLGRGLTVRPSVTTWAGVPAPEARVEAGGDASVDAELRLTANLLASLTLNTDFAETEVDARRTNLTRFPLFFPEKRTFFLEGSDAFEFGLGLGTDVIPFFSRRVGLLAGREVPIRVGAKLGGQIGGARVGAVAVRTGPAEGLTPGSTLAAVRVRQNLFAESAVGLLATIGDPRGGAAWTAGVDATIRTSRLFGNQNFLVGAWLLGSGGDSVPAGDRTAWGLKVDYPNDLVDVALTWKRIGDRFDPPLGFVPRRGVHLLSLGGVLAPRPGRLGIRQLFVEQRLTLAADLDGRWESYRFVATPVNLHFESGDGVEVRIAPQGERLLAPFEVEDGVVIGPGTYRFVRYGVELQSAARRPLSLDLEWSFGGFYTGRLHEFELGVDWRPRPGIALGLDLERNVARLPEGQFQTTLVGARFRYGITPDLEFNSLVQYDTGSRDLGSNSRLRWIVSPAAEVFVIYNHNVANGLDRWAFESNQLAAKLRLALRS